MKTHTSQFKDKIKAFGRELDSKITYTIGGVTTELGSEQLNSVSPHYEGAILKSVMKQLDIDSNVEIPVGTELNYKLGIKVRNDVVLDYRDNYDYIDYGNYIIKEIEKQEDTKSWKITCYDKMLYSMKDYRLLKTKNLLDLKDGSYTTYGVTAVVSNGVITLNNTATQTAFIEIPVNTNLQWVNNSKYSISGFNPSSSNVKIRVNTSGTLDLSLSSSNATSTFIYNNQNDMVVDHLTIRVQSGTALNNFVIIPQLELNEHGTNYTPYFRYPITLRDYLSVLCYNIGLDFASYNDNFANYNKQIANELYLDTEGRSLGYTYRTVLDQIAEATASTICINDNDKLEIRYINQTEGNQLLDCSNLIALTNTTYTWEDNILTVESTTGTYRNVYISLLDLVKNNPSKVLRLDYDSIDFSQSNAPQVQLQITNNGTTTYPTLIAAGGTISNYTIPSNTSNITTVNLRFLTNNSNTSQAGKIVITKPILHFGTTKISFEPYGDTIDEEYLKDINVNFGEKFGPVNTIVLSRGGGGDKIGLSNPTNLADADKIAIQITDNQIMNGNDRDTYLSDILTKLYGLEYYINDYTSTGICYYDICDKYNVKVDDQFYFCIMFNDNVEITQGLTEQIYTDMQEENEQQYKYISSTDRGINQANIIANKTEATITEYTQKIDNNTSRLNAVETKQTDTDRTINVMSTHIDQNGNITEVTTTTGFTFNADGMTISDSETDFSALHRNDGTYYYDGTTIVGKYTKDGSLQKDLHLFGVYYYGMRDINDTPMFVAQLYNDGNGEECFGHFYNRGD